MNGPIGVVIPTYNRAHLLPRAVRSALRQTWFEVEVVVVDDGSTDGTPDVVRGFKDPRVRLIRLDANRGPSRARNVGIQATRAEWVAFLDSDDEWLSDKLHYQMARLAQPGCRATVVYCQGYRHDGLTGDTMRMDATPYEGDVFDRLLSGWRPRTTSVVLVKRSALLDVGGFNETLPCRVDVDLWLRLAQASHQFAAVDRPLIVKHEGIDQRITSDPAVRLRGLEIFGRKWYPTVELRLGRAACRNFRANQLELVQRTRWAQVRIAVFKRDRQAALTHYLAMLMFLPRSRRFVIRALACALYHRPVDGVSRLRCRSGCIDPLQFTGWSMATSRS